MTNKNTKSQADASARSLADIARELEGEDRPPVHKWNPEFCGDIEMRILRDGSWTYMGTPIGRKRMVKLFSTVLKREGDDYFLVTPVEKLGITVDDAPFVAVEMEAEGEGRKRKLHFRTNVDEVITAGAGHPIRVETDEDSGEPSPYIHVRDGLEALIARPVFYDMVELAEEGERNGRTVLGLWSDGEFFELGEAA